MGNKQSNCLVKCRAPFDPLLWNSDDVDNIAEAYKESMPLGPVTAEDMLKVLAELDSCVIFQYGDGRILGSRETCEKFADLLVQHDSYGDDDSPGGNDGLDKEQFVQVLKLVLVLYQVLASEPQRIKDVRENPFNGIMMMEQIAIAAAIQEAEDIELEEQEAAEAAASGKETKSADMLEV